MVLGAYIQATELGPPRPGLGSEGELGYLIYIQKQKEAHNLEEIIQTGDFDIVCDFSFHLYT